MPGKNHSPGSHALITGGAGFIGSHLAETVLEQGYTVTVLDNLSTGRYENLAHLDGHPRLHVVIGTILNEPLVDKLTERCDVVFHLAAAVGVELAGEEIHAFVPVVGFVGVGQVWKSARKT